MSQTGTVAPRINPVAIVRGTMVATDLDKARRMYEELMGLECVRHKPDALLVRERGHAPGGDKVGKPHWVLEVLQVPEITTPQEMLNHWGVELSSQVELDQAYETVAANAEKFELMRVQKPRFRNNSYAFYFTDRDSNWFEMEYREPDLVYTALREREDAPLPEEMEA